VAPEVSVHRNRSVVLVASTYDGTTTITWSGTATNYSTSGSSVLEENVEAAEETSAARRLRLSREGNVRAMREAKGRRLPPMSERTYYRDRFARRACGERWRVII